MDSFKPYITASTLASFIGKHPYRPQAATFYEVLRKDPDTQRKINKILARERRQSLTTYINDALGTLEIQSAITATALECVQSTDMTTILETATVTANAKIAESFPALPTQLQAELANQMVGNIRMKQGQMKEPTIIQSYAQETKQVVSGQNDKLFRSDMGPYVLGGKTDGYVAAFGRVLEVKSRTQNILRPPPAYDIIQLRAYMELTNAKEGELREEYPGLPARSTLYVRDPAVWANIHEEICQATDTLQRIVREPEELKRIVLANSLDG